jgi:hypothetical protein
VNDSKRELDQLQSELRDAYQALDRAFVDEASSWRWSVGPIRVAGKVPADTITTIFVLLNVACFAIGTAFSLLGGILVSLGVALIVGSIFSISAFVSQLWAVAFQRSYELEKKVFGENLEEIKALASKCVTLSEQVKALTDQRDQAVPKPEEGN